MVRVRAHCTPDSQSAMHFVRGSTMALGFRNHMSCRCDKFPDLFKLDSYTEFEQGTERVAVGNWIRLHRCKTCNLLWRIDEWDKYQIQFAAKVPSIDGWESFDTSKLQKDFLIKSRGGLVQAECAWVGCKNLQVKGAAYCADHLFETGARE
jgi:hypothetical protein